ncbi:MAG: methionine aminotransferase [Bacteroidota bacterium]
MKAITSKLPQVGTTIFTVMSALAREHGAINLSQGFPNFDCDSQLKDLVSYYMKKGYNQYPPMIGVEKLRKQIAKKVNTAYGSTVDPMTDITVVAGATQGLFCAMGAFISPGDEVIIIEPAYDSYRPSVEVFGGIPIIYECSAPDYRINWEDFGKLISPKTRLILVNTPHNPTGKCFKREDWKALESLVAGTEILLLSDEVYEHLVFDEEQHQSILGFPELYQRSLAVYSFGKTFHTTGWKVGYIIGPELLMKEFRKVHQFNVFTVHSPTQYALADYLEEASHYEGLANFFQEKRDYFLEQLAHAPFTPIPSEGTYFQLAQYGHLSQENDAEYAKKLTRKYGVAVIPVSAFYSNKRDDKVIRFCFAKTKDLLKQAGERLREVGGSR